jgi:hypothetical protein
MAYTKYSLTPANNNAAPPDGAPEGMLPSAVNDTMRDMMAQIRDCGDGIRGGTYTMTAPVITGGSINNTPIGATTANTGAFTTASLKGSTSGTITLNVPAVAGTNTATLPAATGTVMVSGNMPAFGVTLSADQTVSSNTFTKVAFNVETFDTNNNFDSTTNYRFTPTVAGYYQLNFVLAFPTGANTCIASIYKNGSEYLRGTRTDSSAAGLGSSVSAIVYFNGSSDYVEAYGFTSGTTFAGGATGVACNFNGALVRTA